MSVVLVLHEVGILEDVLSYLSDIATWTVGACTNFEF